MVLRKISHLTCGHKGGSKLRATGFKSWSGRMIVIEVVPIQCSKLFKGMEYAVMSMALCNIKNP